MQTCFVQKKYLRHCLTHVPLEIFGVPEMHGIITEAFCITAGPRGPMKEIVKEIVSN